MLKTKGVPQVAYSIDGEGRRYCLSPFLHYPDYCTYWTDNKEGDCIQSCDKAEGHERPCCQRALGLVAVSGKAIVEPAVKTPDAEPQALEENIEIDNMLIDLDRAEESIEETGTADKIVGPALEALAEQAKSAKDLIVKEQDKLIKAIELVKNRMRDGRLV